MRHFSIIGIAVAISLFSGMVFAQNQAAGPTGSSTAETADLILLNGQIYSPQGWSEALAIKNGVIIAIGSNESVRQFRKPQTRAIDLHGDTVIPGLHDTHAHPMSAGLQQLGCNFPQGSSPQQVLETVKACVTKRAKGEWITGGQWDSPSFGKQGRHRSLLDAVSPDNPTVLSDISMHSVWANSKALQIAGITAKTPNPRLS